MSLEDLLLSPNPFQTLEKPDQLRQSKGCAVARVRPSGDTAPRKMTPVLLTTPCRMTPVLPTTPCRMTPVLLTTPCRMTPFLHSEASLVYVVCVCLERPSGALPPERKGFRREGSGVRGSGDMGSGDRVRAATPGYRASIRNERSVLVCETTAGILVD